MPVGAAVATRSGFSATFLLAGLRCLQGCAALRSHGVKERRGAGARGPLAGFRRRLSKVSGPAMGVKCQSIEGANSILNAKPGDGVAARIHPSEGGPDGER